MLNSVNSTNKSVGLVETYEKAFIYGHYDSRGGGFLVIADTRKEADEKFLRFFYQEEWNDPDFRMLATEDFMHEVTVEVYGRQLPPGTGVEVDSNWVAEGFKYGMQKLHSYQRFGTPTFMMWPGTGPKPSRPNIEDLDLSEDACGLVLIR